MKITNNHGAWVWCQLDPYRQGWVWFPDEKKNKAAEQKEIEKQQEKIRQQNREVLICAGTFVVLIILVILNYFPGVWNTLCVAVGAYGYK